MFIGFCSNLKRANFMSLCLVGCERKTKYRLILQGLSCITSNMSSKAVKIHYFVPLLALLEVI